MREKMKISAIICELNPLHSGHQALFAHAKARFGGLVCVLSGNFVQRGEPALLDKWARTRLALESGADLVLELPLPWALAGAERFAAGGVALARALGCVDTLLFGSEEGDIQPLWRLSEALLSPAFPQALQQVDATLPFAQRRQRAAAHLVGEDTAALLEKPNCILGVEYLKAILSQGGRAEGGDVPPPRRRPRPAGPPGAPALRQPRQGPSLPGGGFDRPPSPGHLVPVGGDAGPGEVPGLFGAAGGGRAVQAALPHRGGLRPAAGHQRGPGEPAVPGGPPGGKLGGVLRPGEVQAVLPRQGAAAGHERLPGGGKGYALPAPPTCGCWA